jgi:hypothetical protein
MSNCSATCLEAGAIIDEETGLMNVNADTINVALHFLLKLQLHTRNHLGRNAECDVKHTFLDFLGHLDHPNQR